MRWNERHRSSANNLLSSNIEYLPVESLRSHGEPQRATGSLSTLLPGHTFNIHFYSATRSSPQAKYIPGDKLGSRFHVKYALPADRTCSAAPVTPKGNLRGTPGRLRRVSRTCERRLEGSGSRLALMHVLEKD
ncbi:hypothetical protein E2C01_082376 [Portunus trituberculatus]|uniref:Uncharacterized protein n=1 Tax=Portunus trituberculatus TaxID=210409 RepID=A0A5B7IZ28_PORTR|nr:hypothetical protein [Portunus trituberculatus]